MAELRILKNPGGQSATITADSVVVGGIGMTGPSIYSVDTKGRIPDIDAVAGTSVDDAWKQVVSIVRGGNVYLMTLISVDP
jgi:hypothetical protein